MEDSLKVIKDSPDSMDTEPVETSAQQHESNFPKKGLEHSENAKSTDPGSNDGMKVDEAGAEELLESNINNKDAGILKQNEAAKPQFSMPHNIKLQAGHVQTLESNTIQNDVEMPEADEAGTEEEQTAFMMELESFYKEKAMEFKPPKFYGEPLNCLKLWRAVTKLGGYELVTASKLWRQVGESFHPPKTCTTVSWTFRIFYEKALLEYEKHKVRSGDLELPISPFLQPTTSVEKEANTYQTPVSGRARRDAAARAMQGWHAQRYIGHGEVTEPIIKDKSHSSSMKRERNLKSIGLQKQKTPSKPDHAEKTTLPEADKQLDVTIVDVGTPADWVKVNVRENKDCFEVYALVPGLLREEVRIQSDPAGRLVITGQPEQLDNPWGIMPFQKVVTLPGRIDPLRTSAVVSLHGRLFVSVPFEQT